MPRCLGFALRLALLLAGMFVMGFGIGSVTKAGLGTTPISALPYTVGEITGLTFGKATFAVNVVLVGAQWVLLRSRFRLINLLQMPLAWVFGSFIDIGMGLVSTPGPYCLRILMNLAGNGLMGLGIWMQLRSRTIVQPGEGFVAALSVVARRPFSTMKIINDISLVVLAALTGLVFLNTVFGIREGTLLSAFLVGLSVKAVNAAARKAGLS